MKSLGPKDGKGRRPPDKGDTPLVEIRRGVASMRDLRGILFEFSARLLSSECSAVLALIDPGIADTRLEKELSLAVRMLRPSLAERQQWAILRAGRLVAQSGGVNPGVLASIIAEASPAERTAADEAISRADSSFVVLHILLNRWFSCGGPITIRALCEASGRTYPTVSRAIERIGAAAHRTSDRQVELTSFPRDAWSQMVASAPDARGTRRYVDRSGRPRSPESIIRRVASLKNPSVAIGGVAGARHTLPQLDLIGSPRVDISLHCPGTHADLSVLEQIDPALQPASDPSEPAQLVVHLVRSQASFFTPSKDGVLFADPVECLLDLHEARLEEQASQFLDALTQRATGGAR
jgi:hypothetical protein